MDELRAFFHGSGPGKPQVRKLRGPLTGGVYLTKEDNSTDMSRKAEHERSVVPCGTDYAREVKQRETELYVKKEMERKHFESMSRGLESLERLTSFGESIQNFGELTEEAMTEVYSKYSFQRKEDTLNLPINHYKQQILDRIQGFPVVIIEGPTGCGKTTQVPQWILDDCYQKHRPCKVVVTQPRRIAAISISKRVAQERGWDVGGLVGYQVGLENKTSSDTRISYVTTGVLLQKLVNAKTMNEYTHIILDEVHERGQEMDFLLLVVKKLLHTVSPAVKIVLMSATFNSQVFADYFMIMTPHGLQNSSCIKIERKEPMFTVKKFYLNQLDKFGAILDDCMPKTGEPVIAPKMSHLVIKLLNAFELIDNNEDDLDRSESGLPSVLIFLPGINEIEDLYSCLMDQNLRESLSDKECAKYKWWVLPLHSTITADEQVRVFQRAPPGNRKIILSTNIAESSITVPDIKYVIDYCLMKTLIADEQTNFTLLQMRWASKTNCEQRAGRAGRVRDGRVYRLVPQKFYNNLEQEVTPEIKRCPLERLVLLSKMLDMGPPSDILALALDPPDISNIHRTLLVLKEIGALKKTIDGEWCPNDGEITYMGRVMAKLPIDVKVSKLIILGHIFGCLEDSIIMAAAMSVKNVFNSPFLQKLNAYNSKLTWADGSTSDCIAYLNVYKVWNHLRQQNYFKHQGNSEVQWARRFFVQPRALREVDDLVRELRQRLAREAIGAGPRAPWARHELPVVLKLIIAGAFYPQYFVQVSVDEDRERDAVKLLGGLDPRNTVYLKNFPDSQPGEIYAPAIKNIIRREIGDEPRVTFDKNCNKVYLTFNDGIDNTNRGRDNSGDPTIPGQVVLSVYKAVKARQLKTDIRIGLLPLEKANALAELLKTKRSEQDLVKMVPRLPELDDTHFPLRISHLINVSNFWVYYDDESTLAELRQIQAALNNYQLIAYTGAVRCGDMYAAPIDDAGRQLHRVKVTKMLPRDRVEVQFLDIGLSRSLSTSTLRSLPTPVSFPPLAMRCRLRGVIPSPLLDARGHWTPQAERSFGQLTARAPLIARVYSVVHGVVSIELLAEGGRVNINQELLKQGYAVSCEESYESKINHNLRQSANELDLSQKRAHNKEQQIELACSEMCELEAPARQECMMEQCLKGPFSPLETNIHTLLYASRNKQVQIEWNSVNSVLLDTDPQQPFERILVAGTVGQNEVSSRLTLRHTTLMPNIPALPAIVSLIFCPTAELRRSADCTRYVSALCGLGSDEAATPYFPEHDLLVNIDADMNVDDIRWVNHIRHLMDYTLYVPEGHEQPAPDDDMRPNVARFIRENLLNLLQKRRKLRVSESVVGAWEWRSISEDDVLEIIDPDMLRTAALYPLHAPPELTTLSDDTLRRLKKENDDLKELVARTATNSSTELCCKLCDTPPLTIHAMRLHLCSNGHTEKEEDFRRFQS